MKMHQRILELSCRYYVFIFLNIYGLGKIMGGQFYRRGSLPEEVAIMTLDNADAFSLAWTFMGYSYEYILFVGILQIIGACLLLADKTKLFGVFILLPIMANIIVFDIIFLDKIGALANASIYFLMLIGILVLNREKLIEAIKILIRKDSSAPSYNRLRLFLGTGVLMALIFTCDQFLVNLLGH